jgi:hypothetical protein
MGKKTWNCIATSLAYLRSELDEGVITFKQTVIEKRFVPIYGRIYNDIFGFEIKHTELLYYIAVYTPSVLTRVTVMEYHMHQISFPNILSDFAYIMCEHPQTESTTHPGINALILLIDLGIIEIDMNLLLYFAYCIQWKKEQKLLKTFSFPRSDIERRITLSKIIIQILYQQYIPFTKLVDCTFNYYSLPEVSTTEHTHLMLECLKMLLLDHII